MRTFFRRWAQAGWVAAASDSSPSDGSGPPATPSPTDTSFACPSPPAPLPPPAAPPPVALAAPPFSFSEALSSLRARLVTRIREVNGISEREILSVGDGVHRIVMDATTYIAHCKMDLVELLDALGGPGARGTVTGTPSVLAQARAVERLAGELASLAARAPEDGVSCADWIPVVHAKAQEIRTVAEGLSSAAASHIEHLEDRITSLGQGIHEVSRTSSQNIDSILLASREALSHLQFQDVVAQGIMQFDGWIRELQVQCAHSEGKSSEAIAPPMQVPVGSSPAGDPDILAEHAGDVLMF
jgi:hypothetical protein